MISFRKLFTLLMIAPAILLVQCGKKIEYEERETIVGYTGEARKNPYLAGQRFLKEFGYDAESRFGNFRKRGGESVVFAPVSSIRSLSDTERILSWVRNGGHYICFMEHGEDTVTDLGAFRGWGWNSADEEANKGQEDFFEKIKVSYELGGNNDSLYEDDLTEKHLRVYEVPAATEVTINIIEDEFKARIAGYNVLSYTGNDHYSVYTDDQETGKHKFISVPVQFGRVTVIADAQPFRNPFIASKEHASLLKRLCDSDLTDLAGYSYYAEYEYGGKVVFSLGQVKGFWELLWETGRYVLIALIVLTVLWIWKSFFRFGPVLELIQSPPRAYLKHVQAHGDFLWRHRKDEHLLYPLQKQALKHIGLIEMSNENIAKAADIYADRTGLSVEDVQTVLAAQKVAEGPVFVEYVRKLQQMMNSSEEK